jgi:hypothetical protein
VNATKSNVLLQALCVLTRRGPAGTQTTHLTTAACTATQRTSTVSREAASGPTTSSTATARLCPHHQGTAPMPRSSDVSRPQGHGHQKLTPRTTRTRTRTHLRHGKRQALWDRRWASSPPCPPSRLGAPGTVVGGRPRRTQPGTAEDALMGGGGRSTERHGGHAVDEHPYPHSTNATRGADLAA